MTRNDETSVNGAHAPSRWDVFRLSRLQVACVSLAWAAGVATAAALVAPGWLAVSAALAGVLALLAAIDARDGVLPDVLTLPLLAAGLALMASREGGAPLAHVMGAVAGYVAFAGLALIYRRHRGVAGLGMGDAKLFAAAGAWLGWTGLPLVALSASALALAFVAGKAVLGERVTGSSRLAFGPHLAAGLWLVWIVRASETPLAARLALI